MQFDVASVNTATPKEIAKSTPSVSADLLRQLLDVQRQQLEIMKAHQAQAQAAMEAQNKKRAWFDRWQDEFPDLPEAARHIMPILERAYLRLMANAVEEIRDGGDDGLESDFAVRDFVDRFGFTLAHLSGILTALTPLTEVANQAQESEADKA
jgi:hypothetical protein